MTEPVDVRSLLDPEIASAIDSLQIDLSTLSAETLASYRQLDFGPPPQLSDEVIRKDMDVPRRFGATVRISRPAGHEGELLPCIYWMHGGGLVFGSNKSDDLRFDRWCRLFPCVGVSVDYGLAPDSPFPGPLDDCYEGLRWVFDNAEHLGIDPSRIGIGGASAGGGLAAGLALLARDSAEFAIAFQLLIYPMIDDRMTTVSSGWQDPIWPPSANRFGWSSYLGALYGTDEVPYRAAAARAVNLSGLPSTFVCVGALDGFSDEDIDYAVRLRHAGVPTELHVYPGAPHGFDALTPNTAVAKRARNDMEYWLQTVLR